MTNTELQRLKEICEAALIKDAECNINNVILFRQFFDPAFCLKLLAVVEAVSSIPHVVCGRELDDAMAALDLE